MSAPPPVPTSGPVYIPPSRRRKRSQIDDKNGGDRNQRGESFNSGTRIKNRAATFQQEDQQPSQQTTKRQQRKYGSRERFHGAFTGGFSAGYFNTVGSAEGWTPTAAFKDKKQRPEDFMDDEDHEQWGGPTMTNQDYSESSSAIPSSGGHGQFSTSSKQQEQSSQRLDLGLNSMLEIHRNDTVGPRLLRVLGWRESVGTAIVPDNDDMTQNSVNRKFDGQQDDVCKVYLSNKRLKRIKLQQSRSTQQSLPPPKLDQCGLGFEAYQNAPEFQQYKNRRQQLARDRARLDNNNNSNTYKLSSRLEGDIQDSEERRHEGGISTATTSGDYLSYETAEDFIGKKSVGGFALRDDEDDAYDDDGVDIGNGGNVWTSNRFNDDGRSTNNQNIRSKLANEYNTEVYEHHDSSDDDGSGGGDNDDRIKSSSISTQQARTSASLSGKNLFSSWASGNSGISSPSNPSSGILTERKSTTSDGKPVLQGFILGIGGGSTSTKRYQGPTIPREYQVTKHVFGENDHPDILYTVSRAVRLQNHESIARLKQNQASLNGNTQQQQPDRGAALSTNFSSLAEAMKNRFTSSTTTSAPHESSTDDRNKGDLQSSQNVDIPRSGLHWPKPIEPSSEPRIGTTSDGSTTITEKKETGNDSSRIQLYREVQTFVPHPLVCKRFGVPIPKHSGVINKSTVAGTRSKTQSRAESDYFQNDILQAVKENRDRKKQEVARNDDPGNATKITKLDIESPDGQTIDRPTLLSLRSIFEADSDKDESTDDRYLEIEKEEKLTGTNDGEHDRASKRQANNGLNRSEAEATKLSHPLVRDVPKEEEEEDASDHYETEKSLGELPERQLEKKRKSDGRRKKEKKERRKKKRSSKSRKRHLSDDENSVQSSDDHFQSSDENEDYSHRKKKNRKERKKKRRRHERKRS